MDRATFQRVQQLLGGHIYHAHQIVYAGELIRCGHCGHPITGEVKTKMTKKGPKEHTYYRCCQYNKGNHPRVRLKEAELDAQVCALFDQIRIDEEDIRDWIVELLKAKTQSDQKENLERLTHLQRQQTHLAEQQDELVKMRMNREITPDEYAKQSTELRDKLAEIQSKLECGNLERGETNDLAIKAFELCQNLKAKWFTADYAENARSSNYSV